MAENNIYDLRNIRVIVGSKPSIPKMKFTKEDSETCQIAFELYRTPSEPLEGISYATVTLRYPSGRDATFGASDVSVVDNVVTFTLPVSALYELGVVEGELQVYGESFKRLTACDFKYTVQDVIIMGEYILNDDRYPILTDLIQIILNSGVAEDERIQNEIQRQENEIQREIEHQNNISEFIAKIKEVDEWILYGNITLDKKIKEVDDKLAEVDVNLAQLVAKISADIEAIMRDVEARTKAMETKVDNKIVDVNAQVGIMWEDYEDLKGTITDENVIGALTVRIQELEKNKSDVGHKHDELYASLSEFNAIKDQIAQNKPIIISDDCPVGTIVFRSRTSGEIPGWLWCDGSELVVDDYLELFSVIGYTYGGSGTVFNLPHLVYGDSLVTMGKEASTGDIILSEADKQQGLIKVKRLSEDMISIAQEVEAVKGVHNSLNQSLQNSYAPLDEFNDMKDQIAQNKPIIINDDTPVGTIVWYTWARDSENWKCCNGQTLNKADFPELWDLIGNNANFGNNGGDTFKVPDLMNQQRFIRSVDNWTYNVGATQSDELKLHSHKIGLAREANGNDGNYQTIIGSQGNVGRQPGGYCPENGDPAYTVNAIGGEETRPVNMALVPYIKCKQRAKDMVTVAQEWTQFKDNGGDIGGTINIINGSVNAQGVYAPTNHALTLSSKNGAIYLRPNNSDVNGIVVGGQSGTLAPMEDNVMLLGNSSRRYKDMFLAGYNANEVGYSKTPNGMIMQWGRVGISADTGFATLPVAFPTKCFQVVATGGYAGGGTNFINVYNKTTSRFDWRRSGTNLQEFFWMAIGN